MKKKYCLILILTSLTNLLSAQIKWSRDTSTSNKIEWNNYSTSFEDKKNDPSPIIVTALPYNGFYSNSNDINAPLDISFDGSLFRFKSDLNENTRIFYTYDSSEVYFLTPRIYPSNSEQYEYRVTLDAKTIIVPWHTVDKFSSIGLNSFPQGFGYLGGFKTTWGNFIIVELRKKSNNKILSRSIVSWKEIKPKLTSVYTSENFNDFLKSLKRPWDKTIKAPNLPKKIILQPGANNIIFDLAGEIYKRDALEYSLIKNDVTIIDWRPNDYDNNFVWLKNLLHGDYVLRIRYARQRQSVSEYNFYVEPFWYQTNRFYVILGFFTLPLITLIIAAIYYRRKIKKEKNRKEKLSFELKAIRSQLNPHFVFNALNSIQGLINKNDVAKANIYLTEFSSLLRESLKNNDKEFVPLNTELKTLETYVKLEQLRFHFNYNFSVDENIQINAVELPSLLLQPIVENAIKHGVAQLYENGIINIKIYPENKNLNINIADNGNGFNTQTSNNGFGLKLTKERIELLNQSNKNQLIKFKTESTDNGTTVYLIFENWL